MVTNPDPTAVSAEIRRLVGDPGYGRRLAEDAARSGDRLFAFDAARSVFRTAILRPSGA